MKHAINVLLFASSLIKNFLSKTVASTFSNFAALLGLLSIKNMYTNKEEISKAS